MKTVVTLVFSFSFSRKFVCCLFNWSFFEGTFFKKRDILIITYLDVVSGVISISEWKKTWFRCSSRIKRWFIFQVISIKTDEITSSFYSKRCHQKLMNVRNQLSGSRGWIPFHKDILLIPCPILNYLLPRVFFEVKQFSYVWTIIAFFKRYQTSTEPTNREFGRKFRFICHYSYQNPFPVFEF